ncbi:MAG: phosphohydrolase [Vallitaleaceae bacterium]|nr:phosphohydrolase [Vallitaleaceae bacterium]
MNKNIRRRSSHSKESYREGFIDIIRPVYNNRHIQEMRLYPNHRDTSCLEHSLNVSYTAYRIGKALNLDAKSLARASMFHDFYLYDWHIKGNRKGLHGMMHAAEAYNNTIKYFEVNEKEKDMILTHMWPLNPKLPKYIESILLMCVDRYCTVLELLKIKSYRNDFSKDL